MVGNKLEKLMRRTRKNDNGCLIISIGYKARYSCTTYNGKKILCHRLAWILTNGEIKDDLHVLHKCDNTFCINPDHLFLGTQKDNIRDMMKKGRDNRLLGEKHQFSKLKNDDVRFIRNNWPEISQADLAKEFNVTSQNIHDIVHRKHWKWME